MKGWVVLLVISLLASPILAYTNQGTYLECDSCSDCTAALANTTLNVTRLGDNITGTGTCITVATSNETLDCRGYSISYAQSATGDAISAYASSPDNLAIRNCVITQGGSSLNSRGLRLRGDGHVLVNLSITTTTSGATGLVLESMTDLVVDNLSVTTAGANAHDLSLLDVTNASFSNVTASVGGNAFSLWLRNSTNCSFAGVSFENAETKPIELEVSVPAHARHSFQDVTDNGAPVLYVHNRTGYSLDGNESYGQRIFSSCEDLSLRNMNLTNASTTLLFTGNATITNVTSATARRYEHPLSLDFSDNVSIHESAFTAVGTGANAIALEDVEALIVGNVTATTTTTSVPLSLYAVENATIGNSTFNATGTAATRLESSSGNRFSNNIFSSMITDPVAFADASPNSWNATLTAGTNIVGGPFLSGNYYVAAGSADIPLTCDGSDCYYDLEDGNRDHYPLNSNWLVGCTDIDASGTYLLSDNISATGTCMNITADDVTLECYGYMITGDESVGTVGIRMNGTNVTLSSCIILSFEYGIDALSSSDHTFDNITASNNTDTGIRLDLVDDAVLNDIITSDNGVDGMSLRNCSGIDVSSLVAHANPRYGVSVFGTTASAFTGMNVSNATIGIVLNDSSGNDFEEIRSFDNSGDGLSMNGSDNNDFLTFSATNNTGSGISLAYAERNDFDEVTAGANGGAGIVLDASNRTTVSSADLRNNTLEGLSVNASDACTFTNVTASGNGVQGIVTRISSVNDFSDITVAENGGEGLLIGNASATTLVGITASANDDEGIRVESAETLMFEDVLVEDNTDEGLEFDNVSSSTITLIEARNHTVHVSFDTADDITMENGTFAERGGLWLANMTRSDFADIAVSGDNVSIDVVWGSNHNSFTDVRVTDADGGFYFERSYENLLGESLLQDIDGESAVSFYGSANNTLRNTTIMNVSPYYPVHLDNWTSGGYLTENIVITGCTFSRNENHSLFIEDLSGTRVYNNVFADDFGILDLGSSTYYVDRTLGENVVGGPYLGGNYYTNAAGTGFSSRCADADDDGICDRSYDINENNTDEYPLTNYTEPDEPPDGDGSASGGGGGTGGDEEEVVQGTDYKHMFYGVTANETLAWAVKGELIRSLRFKPATDLQQIDFIVTEFEPGKRPKDAPFSNYDQYIRIRHYGLTEEDTLEPEIAWNVPSDTDIYLYDGSWKKLSLENGITDVPHFSWLGIKEGVVTTTTEDPNQEEPVEEDVETSPVTEEEPEPPAEEEDELPEVIPVEQAPAPLAIPWLWIVSGIVFVLLIIGGIALYRPKEEEFELKGHHEPLKDFVRKHLADGRTHEEIIHAVRKKGWSLKDAFHVLRNVEPHIKHSDERLDVQATDENLKKLHDYVTRTRGLGWSDEKITEYLESAGWDPQIAKVLLHRNEGPAQYS